MAGHYVHTSRKSYKRIPISPIIERLKKEKVLDTISYNADNHRATCYVLPVNHKSIVLERINTLQNKIQKKEQITQQIKKPDTNTQSESKTNTPKKFNGLEFDTMKKYLIQAYINDLITYNDLIGFTKVMGIDKINIQDNKKTIRNLTAYNKIYDVLKSRGYDMIGIIRL